MTAKILVADDSLTIQKVVGITLANEPYILSECVDEKSGYELAAEVNKRSSNTSVMVMLGTFDTVDDSKLEEHGVSAKIVKPFESSRFIQECRELIEGNEEEEVQEETFENESSILVEESNNEDTEEDIGDGWVVDAPESITAEFPDPIDSSIAVDLSAKAEESVSSLVTEMEGWGMAVPGVIGSESNNDMSLFPPVIGGVEAQTQSSFSSIPIIADDIEDELEVNFKEEPAAVSNEDFDYPEMKIEEPILEPEVEEEARGSEPEALENISLSSRLASLDELAPEEEEVKAEEVDQEENRDLASEIEENVSADDFWAADSEPKQDINAIEVAVESEIEDHSLSSDLADLDEGKSEVSFDTEVEPVEEVAAKVMRDEEATPDEIVEQIKESLTPMIEELVKNYCKERVEQVAWEIIPDLAENLIRKEIQEISQSVQN
jgi:CheY-like chemotaxis protein